MTEDRDTLSYHGRRAVDELFGAMASENWAAVQAHSELTRLHLDRFVATIIAAVERTSANRSPTAD